MNTYYFVQMDIVVLWIYVFGACLLICGLIEEWRNRALHAAIRRGTITNGNPGSRDSEGITAFCRAVESHNCDLVYALSNRPGWDECNHGGSNALHIAAKMNSTMLITLIRLGLNVNAEDVYGIRPIHIALLHGNWECVYILKAVGAECVDHADLSPRRWRILTAPMHPSVVRSIRKRVYFSWTLLERLI